MDVFELHRKVMDEYQSFVRSFIQIKDDRIDATVREALEGESLWPSPLLQLNPSYERGETLADLVASDVVHPELPALFGRYQLYRHQVEAIRLGASGRDFVVTSGTGSGKSLTYLGTIFNEVLQGGAQKGVQALIVYPTNALINSQTQEIEKYRADYEDATGRPCPVRSAQYTGQEGADARMAVLDEQPQILLTNYMMLELMMTRRRERALRESLREHLRFMVYDELHTYRGRQGADVGVLNRRVRTLAKRPVVCIGTSATMASGTRAEQKAAVAEVASKLFGKGIGPDQVVDEKLERGFTWGTDGGLEEALRAAVLAGPPDRLDEAALTSHPLPAWLEGHVGLEYVEDRWRRRTPVTQGEAATQLAEASGTAPDIAAAYLERFLDAVAELNVRRESEDNPPLLPFKLHQFIAQTGSAYVTLEAPAERYITLEPGRFRTLGDGSTLPLFPIVFSRVSGHEMLCVRRTDDGTVAPRDFDDRARTDEDDDEVVGGDGYLVLEHDGVELWTQDDVENLPASWRTKDGTRIKADRQGKVPQPVSFEPDGTFSEDPDEFSVRGWWLPLAFRIDPTSGTFYPAQTGDFTKVARLGSEARSTSTSVLAYATSRALAGVGAGPTERKLLSFVDNRQDASLQSGHFNDFLRVVQLRGAVYASAKATPEGLNASTLGASVADSLGLPESAYARQPRESGGFVAVRNPNREAFEAYLFYRALHDLRRSWRIVLPNLEQCGLLRIGYRDLEAYAAQDAGWAGVPGLDGATPGARLEVIHHVLDYFRRQFALAHKDLEEGALREQERHIRERLRSPWTLDDKERLPDPRYMVLREPTGARYRRRTSSLGYMTKLGFYLRSRPELEDVLTSKAAYTEFLIPLLDLLTDQLGYLRREPGDGPETNLYRLNVETIEWRASAGEEPAPDIFRYQSLRPTPPPPVNVFFRDLYREALDRDGDGAVAQRGEEHTAMVSRDDRIEREGKFRDGEITALFCSPTMELGIDIAKLSVVHMRNVPPGPANYAQRSGRAGRSGQGALVLTYCASQSPHDSHYFQHRADMVAGQVTAPSLDLANEELLRAHLHAVYLGVVGLNELDRQDDTGGSIASLLDMSAVGLPMLDEVRGQLTLDPERRAHVGEVFRTVIADLIGDVPWVTSTWVAAQVEAAPKRFDKALDRWRSLFLGALRQQAEAEVTLNDITYKAKHPERRKAMSALRQALRQRDLLMNDGGRSSGDSEFYPYRYLASTGYLPGYNFYRLPIRAFLGDGDTGTYVSRGRLMGIREFGPYNRIYFNGGKYAVNQIEVADVEGALTTARVATASGYFLEGAEASANTCPLTGTSLLDGGSDDFAHLLEVTDVRATRTDSITCEEEERLRSGFDLDVYVSTPDGGASAQKLRLHDDGQTLVHLTYLPGARLHVVNSGWSYHKEKGFLLRADTRFFERSPVAKDPDPERPLQPVMLTTNVTADAIYLHPTGALGLEHEGVLTLQYALQKAVELVFQVERGEIGVETLGDPPNILLYEASEGSLGVLRRLVQEPALLAEVFQAAWELLHFDLPPAEEEAWPPASYADLLSYYNQRHHPDLDRHLVRPALERLRACAAESLQAEDESYDDQFARLRSQADPNSSLELRFLDGLHERGLRLPDSAQRRVEGLYVQPDFFYGPNLVVFVDGSVHDDSETAQADARKRKALVKDGYRVLVYRYDDDLDAVLAAHSDIIRPARQPTLALDAP